MEGPRGGRDGQRFGRLFVAYESGARGFGACCWAWRWLGEPLKGSAQLRRARGSRTAVRACCLGQAATRARAPGQLLRRSPLHGRRNRNNYVLLASLLCLLSGKGAQEAGGAGSRRCFSGDVRKQLPASVRAGIALTESAGGAPRSGALCSMHTAATLMYFALVCFRMRGTAIGAAVQRAGTGVGLPCLAKRGTRHQQPSPLQAPSLARSPTANSMITRRVNLDFIVSF